MTPQKCREFERVAFAVTRLGIGMSVKAGAAELGCSDRCFLSRSFGRFIGSSPSADRLKRRGLIDPDDPKD